MRPADELLLEISHCSEISIAAHDKTHTCHSIVNTQDPSWDGFQLPEPWSGDLENAKLLFIASNPSINFEESYPNKIWPADVIVDFFRNRFDPNTDWTENRKVLLADGKGYARKSVAFWNSVNRQAERAFGRNVVMGVDFAMTEVVHCKSVDEKGVSECLTHCSKKWMTRILEISHARVIILMGSQAATWFASNYGPVEAFGIQGQFEISVAERLVVNVPHPSSWAKVKRLDRILSERELQRLQRILNS